ncbi:MAG: hypothetical protein N3G22_01450 [Candidatus Micrarchaeota archaeon]|nr:hypothetical protein [Candidatus Micrarchaeota archaeon]
MSEKPSAIERGEYIIGIAIILAALFVSATIYISMADVKTAIYSAKIQQGQLPGAQVQQNNSSTAELKVIVINDKRCTDCQDRAEFLIAQIRSLFPDAKLEKYDYSDAEGKKIYSEIGGKEKIPLVLFTPAVKDSDSYSNVAAYLVKKGNYFMLRVGSEFDPTAEICGNGIDDDSNGAADCNDPACSTHISCMPKLDKPVVELFVMSHCPYGTQMEKGMLPVIDLLGNKVDWNIRFVSYAMHGETEVREQQLQYCIQKYSKSKYFEYLRCFLNSSKTEECLAATGLSRSQFQKCYDEADKKFNITAILNDRSSWLNGVYPKFNIDAELNEKYGVGGSPTFVINGIVNEGQGRDPASILQTVCLGFKVKPPECDRQLSTQSYTPGFGFEFQSTGAIAAGSCG